MRTRLGFCFQVSSDSPSFSKKPAIIIQYIVSKVVKDFEKFVGITLESLFFTSEEHLDLQPLMYNRFRAFKCSSPGMSSTFLQFVRLSSCKIFSLERSDILSNEKQFARLSCSKLHGRGGRHFSSRQSYNESSLRFNNPSRLDGRL